LRKRGRLKGCRRGREHIVTFPLVIVANLIELVVFKLKNARSLNQIRMSLLVNTCPKEQVYALELQSQLVHPEIGVYVDSAGSAIGYDSHKLSGINATRKNLEVPLTTHNRSALELTAQLVRNLSVNRWSYPNNRYVCKVD